MNHDEFMQLGAAEAADKLNELIAAGKTQEEAEAEFGLSKQDKLALNIFWVKDQYRARSWGGYVSTKRTGNELGDSFNGVGDHDPSKGFHGC